MKFKFLNSIFLSLILSAASITANAGLLFTDPLNELADPSIINSQTAHSSAYAVGNVFDNNVSGNGNGAGNVYATGSNTRTVANAFIDFDFGIDTNLEGFVFYQRGNNDDTVFSFNLFFSNSVNFSTIIETLSFGNNNLFDFSLKGNNSANHRPDRQEFEFVLPIAARYVKWDVTSSRSIYDGAAEMEFWGSASQVPEPSTLAIFALGMIGIASRRFKK
jgi:hypothetical protein